MIVAAASSIGESVITLGLCDHLRRINGELTLLMRHEHKELLNFYNLDDVCVKFGSLVDIRRYATSRGFSVYHRNKQLVSIDPYSNGDLDVFTKIIERNCGWTPLSYIKWCLGVSDEICPVLPNLESVNMDATNYCEKKSIFFSLGSNTNSPLPDVVAQTIFDDVTARGYEVVFNVAGAHHIPKVKGLGKVCRLGLAQAVHAYLSSDAAFVSSSGLACLLGALTGHICEKKPPVFVLRTDRKRIEQSGKIIDVPIFKNKNFCSFQPHAMEMISDSGAYTEVDVSLSSAEHEHLVNTQKLMRRWSNSFGFSEA